MIPTALLLATAAAHWLAALDRGEPGAVALALGLVLAGAVAGVVGRLTNAATYDRMEM